MPIAHHRDVLDRITISDFGCIRDLDLTLTPIHALIGPNDTGKSTVLRAIHRALVQSGQVPGIAVYEQNERWGLDRNEDSVVNTDRAFPFGHAAIVRWQPDSLKVPSKQVVHPLAFLTNGTGLPGMLARSFLASPSALADTNTRLTKTFPTIKSLRVQPTSEDLLGILFELKTSRVLVSANEMSDGVLYWLAFDTLRYLEGDWVLLLEEPENGLHPSRIAEVMRSIRNVVETSAGKIQVIMATHSPIVVNELRPEEVTLITRDAERGSIATPIVKTQNFAERSKVYALGELWLSYANGRDEADLVPLVAE